MAAQQNPPRHGIVVLTAPSGAGKTTIARRVLQALPRMRFSVSVTTRPPRPHEQDGVHYHFVSPEQFERHVAAGDLLEYEEVYPGLFYGTLRSAVEEASAGAPVLLDVDVQGALSVKEAFADDALAVFIRPPSLDVLRQRLHDRDTETSETLALRLRRAEKEMTYADRFDAVVVNDALDVAVGETLRLVEAFLHA